ncbi:MAG: hypothetical protein QOG69_2857 [Actinomycetota bacterium]|jgi:quinol monooxygenase YgiN|nr:hypothetical protein [Actinomycetota bacterium]
MSELLGIARFTFHKGKVEEYKRLNEQCMEIVRTKDTGMLQYEVYFNDDESQAVVLERYKNSTALMKHSANISHLMEPIMATASVSGELLGEASAELKASLADGPVGLFTLFQSI